MDVKLDFTNLTSLFIKVKCFDSQVIHYCYKGLTRGCSKLCKSEDICNSQEIVNLNVGSEGFKLFLRYRTEDPFSMVGGLSRPEQILLLETFLELFDFDYEKKSFLENSFDDFPVVSDAIFQSYSIYKWEDWNEYAKVNSLNMYNCKDAITLLKDVANIGHYKNTGRNFHKKTQDVNSVKVI